MKSPEKSSLSRAFSVPVVALAALGLLLSGCSSGDEGSDVASITNPGAESAPDAEDIGAGACDLLTPARAGVALGGEAELSAPYSGPNEDGTDLCVYGLVGGAGPTYVSLTIFTTSADSYGGLGLFESSCDGAAVLSHVDDVAPGALRCLVVASDSGDLITEDVAWEDSGKAYAVRLNGEVDGQFPPDAGLDVAKEIAAS